jgi:hypothetical protein
MKLFILLVPVGVVFGAVTINTAAYAEAPQAKKSQGPQIQLIEATYGPNCGARAGNATASMKKVCDAKRGACPYIVDVANLGDPAVGCGKNFVAKWRCGTDTATNERTLPTGANRRTITIECPVRP